MLPPDRRSWTRQQEAFLDPLPVPPLLPLATGNMGTAGSHLWQLWDLNQLLEVLQVAGAVEKVLEPARGREWLGIALIQPRQAPVWHQGLSPGHHTLWRGRHFVLPPNSGKVLEVLPLLKGLSHKPQT